MADKKAIRDGVKELQKSGVDIRRLGDGTIDEDVESIPSRSLTLDYAMGVGGYPKGRLIEIFGPESGGKSTISYLAIASCQELGGTAALIDIENSFEPSWGRSLGINAEDLYIARPEYAEKVFDVILKLVQIGVDLIVIDSTAALVPKSEAEGDMEKNSMALVARIMSKGCRKLNNVLTNKKTIIIFINQIREKVGTIWGCIHSNGRIKLADGSSMTISNIVNKKIKTKVLSYNEKTKKIESKKIIGWHKNGYLNKNDNFLQLVGEKHFDNGKINIPCTKNHIIYKYINNKIKEVLAESLKVGDKIATIYKHYELTNDIKQVIYGSILGDGYLKSRGNYKGSLIIKHSNKQKNYCLFKQNVLSKVVKNKCKDIDVSCFDTVPMHQLSNLSYHLKNTNLRNCIIPKEIINNIDLFGLAIWYLDDGNFKAPRTNKGRGRCSISCTKFKNKKEMMRIFFKFGLKPKLTEGGFVFNAENTYKFHKLICKYVPKSMHYKIHPNFYTIYKHKINKHKIKSYSTIMPTKIIKIYNKPIPKKGGRAKYDLTIEENSNYFVDYGLVHNSPEVTTGGRALKFYSAIRIRVARLTKSQKFNSDKEAIGHGVAFKIVKNKVAAPFKNGDFYLSYKTGIKRSLEVFELGVKFEIIEVDGRTYTYKKYKWNGHEQCKTELRKNRKLREELSESIRKKF